MPKIPKDFKCGQCGRVFPTPDQLQEHERKMHPETLPKAQDEPAERERMR